MSLGAYTGISEWWTIPGFPEWFLNQDEFRQKLEFSSIIALDRLTKILENENANSNSQVAAAKLIMELSRKLTSATDTDKYLDQKIADMDRKQLEQFIQSRISLVSNK